MLQMADTHLTKNCSILLSRNISGLHTLILYLGDVLHLLDIPKWKSDGMREILFPG